MNFDLHRHGDSKTILHARNRAIAVLIAMILGISIAQNFELWGSLVWMSIGCGLIGISIPVRKRTKSILILVSVFFIAAGWSDIRLNEPKSDRLDQIVEQGLHSRARTNSVPVQIVGIVTEPVRTRLTPRTPADPATWTTSRTETRIRVQGIILNDTLGNEAWVNASGIARLIVPNEYSAHDSESVFKPGDWVSVIGLYQTPTTARNLSDLDWESMNIQSGRVGTIVVRDLSMIQFIEHGSFFDHITRWFIHTRAILKSRSLSALGVNQIALDKDETQRRAMLAALLLGEREPAFGDVYESFQRVGVAHVLAISGFHLALVILLGIFFIRVIGEHPKIETICVVSILTLGFLIIPMRPPIVRAGMIVCLLLLASRCGRRYDRLTILAWVGTGLLIWRPSDVFSLGYQLSMGITALLVILANQHSPTSMSILTNQLPSTHQRFFKRTQTRIVQAIKINFACWIVAAPAIMFHAGFVSLLAPVVAFILIPMVMILMIVGYIQIGIGVFFPSISESLIGLLDFCAAVVHLFVRFVDSLPGSSVQIGNPGFLWTLIFTGVLTLIITGKLKLNNYKTAVYIALCISWLFVAPFALSDRASLRLHMIDVGDGTSIVVESQGKTLLWDCGSLNRRVGKGISRDLQSLGIRRIEDVVVTHDNLDHFNGLADLASRVPIDRVWITDRLMQEPSTGWKFIQTTLETMGVEIRVMQIGDELELGNARVDCLWPNGEHVMTMRSNNTSIVMRIQVPITIHNNSSMVRSVLLTGDIEQEAMTNILQEHPDLSCDVLELPHHGSAKARAYSFVEKLDPSVVLQSTGMSRANDPRWDEMRSGRVWYTTAVRGGAWVRIYKDGNIVHGWTR